MEERFLADCMLGRLAKWLRILGYDTHYRRMPSGESARAPDGGEDRRLLTRREALKGRPGVVFIRSDHVGEQLRQMAEEGWIRPDPERTFRRCPVCNNPLEEVDLESTRERVPDYVFHRHAPDFRRCPACGRHYWHGSHRERMRAQLEAWGLTGAGRRGTPGRGGKGARSTDPVGSQ
jgi:hypothetical protein